MTRYARGPVDSPGFLLWHATMRWQRQVVAVLEPLGLTHVQFVILACVWWATRNRDLVNQAGIAAIAGTDPTMTSEVIGRLETKGLIIRVRHPHDSRAKSISPTAAGVDIAARAIRAVERVDAGFFGGSHEGSSIALLRRLAGDGAGTDAPITRSDIGQHKK
jgi:DNA-binding MarR family transcriptional regulator